MRRAYPVLLLLALSLTAQAQPDHVTHDDTGDFKAKLVRVFEWVLDNRFTSAQRNELSTLVDRYFRSGNQADVQTLQDIVKLNDVIDTIPPDRKTETHAAIQTTIVEQLKKEPNDPMARLLLSVYENRRTINSPEPAPGPKNVASTSSRGIPPELVGEWQARRGSGSSYSNPNTGSYSAPNATIDSYKFFADGRYEHSILMQNSLYNCTVRVFGHETGRASNNAEILSITPGPGTLEYTDTCRPQLNSKKATNVDGQSWQWQIERDEYGVKLCVRDSQGASACYYRQ